MADTATHISRVLATRRRLATSAFHGPRNLIVQAVVTMDGAKNRTESRGAHAREDFSERDDKAWMKHTLATVDPEAKTISIDYRPVHSYTMSNDMQYIEPKARVY